jgi:hypothetical protein
MSHFIASLYDILGKIERWDQLWIQHAAFIYVYKNNEHFNTLLSKAYNSLIQCAKTKNESSSSSQQSLKILIEFVEQVLRDKSSQQVEMVHNLLSWNELALFQKNCYSFQKFAYSAIYFHQGIQNTITNLKLTSYNKKIFDWIETCQQSDDQRELVIYHVWRGMKNLLLLHFQDSVVSEFVLRQKKNSKENLNFLRNLRGEIWKYRGKWFESKERKEIDSLCEKEMNDFMKQHPNYESSHDFLQYLQIVEDLGQLLWFYLFLIVPCMLEKHDLDWDWISSPSCFIQFNGWEEMYDYIIQETNSHVLDTIHNDQKHTHNNKNISIEWVKEIISCFSHK